MPRIVIYQDKGVAESFLPIWQTRLQQSFGQQLEVRYINAQDLCSVIPLEADMLIMPGGQERFYQEELQDRGNDNIINFVLNGGVYLGVCGGAYYASREIDFTWKNGEKIKTRRSLEFFPATAVGSIPEYAHGDYYDEDPITANIVDISWQGMGLETSTKARNYYHGGCYFLPSNASTGEWQICGTYPQGQIAALHGKMGKGRFFLSGVHIEVDFAAYRDFLYPRYTDKNPEVMKQCRTMMGLDSGIFNLLMSWLLGVH